jgi:hypothetical protein
MRWPLLTLLVLLSMPTAFAQTESSSLPEAPTLSAESYPEANPADQNSADQNNAARNNVVAVAEASFQQTGDGVKTCNAFRAMKLISLRPNPVTGVRKSCSELVYPYQQFLSTNVIIPMTWQQKGYLAVHNLADPANFGTIVGISAITVGIDSHSAYGPGLKGFGKTVGVSLLQDTTGQFFGAFAIPSLVHQDPRYFRMPQASIPRRIVYCISRTYVSRHDDGTPMPNYATLLTYPISAGISNLYVPGIHADASSTVARIATGIATDPVNNLLTEFLPDVASRFHIRIVFVQRILNNIASGANGVTLQ